MVLSQYIRSRIVYLRVVKKLRLKQIVELLRNEGLENITEGTVQKCCARFRNRQNFVNARRSSQEAATDPLIAKFIDQQMRLNNELTAPKLQALISRSFGYTVPCAKIK